VSFVRPELRAEGRSKGGIGPWVKYVSPILLAYFTRQINDPEKSKLHGQLSGVKKTLESELFSPEDAPYPEDMARLLARFMLHQVTLFPSHGVSVKKPDNTVCSLHISYCTQAVYGDEWLSQC